MDRDKGVRRMRIVVVSTLVAVFVCIGSAAPAQPNPLSVSSSAIRDCTSGEGHLLVVRFIRAFNVGARARLDALWARDDHDGDAGTPSFQWYSTGKPGDRAGREATDRSTLIRYFAARHRRGERLRLVYMSPGGNSNGYFHFAFQIHRRARDMRRPGVFEGKGAAICSHAGAQLAVWSVGPHIATG